MSTEFTELMAERLPLEKFAKLDAPQYSNDEAGELIGMWPVTDQEFDEIIHLLIND